MSRKNLTPGTAIESQAKGHPVSGTETPAEVPRHGPSGLATSSAGSSPLSHTRPVLLDLFCGAGGAAEGYRRAGFEVVGVDIKPQPNYPFKFHRADALAMLESVISRQARGEVNFFLGRIDAVHASPPCPRYSAGSTNWNGRPESHPDLIGPTRYVLERSGLPYVMENVPGAPMENAIMLCGSSFRLRVRRHRLFECNFPVMALPCAHGWQRSNTTRLRSGYEPPEDSVVPVYGGGQAGFDVATCREAMGIDWMTTDELNDAIPPAYTEHIGGYLLTHLQQEVAA